MTHQRSLIDYVNDMLANAELAQRFTRNVSFETFQQDDQKSYAVVRALEIIGEAARHIPKTVRRKYAQIQWDKATGMRDKMIHAYFGVDLEVVWKTVHEDLPTLQSQLTQMLRELQAAEAPEDD